MPGKFRTHDYWKLKSLRQLAGVKSVQKLREGKCVCVCVCVCVGVCVGVGVVLGRVLGVWVCVCVYTCSRLAGVSVRARVCVRMCVSLAYYKSVYLTQMVFSPMRLSQLLSWFYL